MTTRTVIIRNPAIGTVEVPESTADPDIESDPDQ